MSLDVWQFIPLMVAVAAVVRFAPLMPQRLRIPASVAVMLVFLCWAPFVLIGFQTLQLTRVAVWLVAAMGLNILTGYNGQISLGHGALVAMGAYTAAILMDGTGQLAFVDSTPWPFWAAIIAAGVVTACFGLLLGFPALRLSGPYLAIATLALAISFPNVVRKYDGLTGGSQGILVSQPQPPSWLDSVLNRDQWLYFVTLIVAMLMLLLAWSILRGPLGRAFVAVRDNEVAAEALGVNIAQTKIIAFTISAFFAGIAGGLYTQVFGFISPNAISLLQSINLLAVIVIGGLASILGSVIGAAALVFIPTDAPGLVGRIPGLSIDFLERSPGAIQGALVIVVILMFPAGLAGLLQRLERLRPAAVLAGLKAAPAGVLVRADAARGRLSSVWDVRPWRQDLSRGREHADADDEDDTHPS